MSEEAPANDSFALMPGEGHTITIGPNQITYKLGGEHTGLPLWQQFGIGVVDAQDDKKQS